MFIARVTPEAKAELARLAQVEGLVKPGIMVCRQGPRGDVKRTSSGLTQWEIERPHPWRAQVADFASFGEDPEDVFEFDGVLVWLALVPKPGEVGVVVSVRNGDFHVQPLGA